MAQRILGLDLGARAVKAVVLESAYRGFSVVAARELAVAPPEGDAPAPLRARQADAVRALLAEGLLFDAAVVGLPGTSAAHHVTLPFDDPRRIEQTVGFEVEAQIPYDLDEVAWDWQPLHAAPGRSDLLVAVVRKGELADLLAALAGAGVDPRAVVPPAVAYPALFEAGLLAPAAAAAHGDLAPAPVGLDAADAPAAEGATASDAGPTAPEAEAVLDVGASRTSLCVVAGGTLEAARTFSSPPLGEPAALLREIRTTLRAWRGRVGPAAPRLGRILLAGEAARAPSLAQALATEARSVEPLALDPRGPAAAIPAGDAPRFALALALAVRGHAGGRGARLNLRRGELAYTRDFQHVRGKVVRLAAWASLLVLLALLSTGVRAFALARQERLLDRALCDATQKLVGRCYEDFDTAVSVLRGKGTAAAAVPRNSAVDVFAELAARTPGDGAQKFDRIEITRDKLHLQGVADTAEGVDRIVSALRGSRCFGDARSGGARRRGSDGKFEFTIDSDLTCDTGEKPAAKGG